MLHLTIQIPGTTPLQSTNKFSSHNSNSSCHNGNGLPINRTVHITISTIHKLLHANDILYFPNITKTLISAKKFTKDFDERL